MVNKELSKGSIGMLLLSILSQQDMYGYQMIKELESQSENVFTLKEGTLYPLLHIMEKNGFLEAYWQQDNGRKRKYYTITNNGRDELKKQTEEWFTFSNAVTQVVNNSIQNCFKQTLSGWQTNCKFGVYKGSGREFVMNKKLEEYLKKVTASIPDPEVMPM